MPDPDVLMNVDEGGCVTEWRRPAEERFGWSAEEAVGRPFVSLMREAGPAWGRGGESGVDAGPLLVDPVLRGGSVVWRVRAARAAAPGRTDTAFLEAMFTQFPGGLLVLDDRLRVVRANSAVPQPRHVPVGHLLGRRFSEVCAAADPEEEAAVVRGVLEGGEPVVHRLVQGHEARDSEGDDRGGRRAGRHEHRTYSTSYFRLGDTHGAVVGLIVSTSDVTEREEARRRAALLDTVRTRVGHELNVLAVCEELAETVVPDFAGLAAVEVVEGVVCGGEPPPAPVDQDIALRRTAFRGPSAVYPVADMRSLPTGTPYSDVMSDLRPRLVEIAEDSPWLAEDPVLADSVRRSGVHSMIVAPMTLGGQVLGVVTFYRGRGEDSFDAKDVELASAVCAHAALCVNNARQYMREWIIASTVQRRLLPQRPVAQTTVETSHLHLPGPEGDGAWFDAIALPGARTALVVGAVAGRGIAAAITMGQMRTAIHTLSALDLPPDELLARLSDTASRLATERLELSARDPLHREALQVSCALAVYDPVDLTCAIARAGIPEPVVVLPDGTSADLLVPQGPLLDGRGDAPFPATRVDLPEGSTLAMGTAGLADEVLAPDGRLRALLGTAGGRRLPELCGAIKEALASGGRRGETLMLLARTRALSPDRVLVLALSADPEAAPVARAAARRQLALWGVDEETAFTSELIVSELVGNAVRYGTSPLRLRLILDRKLTCEVSDGATSAPHVKHARTIDETGRGLFIVASLADQWGTRYGEGGKTVWAEQPARSPENVPLPP